MTSADEMNAITKPMAMFVVCAPLSWWRAFQRLLANAAASGGDPGPLIRAVALVGDPEAAKARLQAYRDAGGDLPVVYPAPALEPVSSMLGTILALAPHPTLEA